MTAAANFNSLACGLGRRAWRRGLADGVGQRLQVVGLRWLCWRVPDGQPHDVPATGCRHPIGVPDAQVVAMRFHECGEGPQNRRRVTVDVGERVDGQLLTSRPRALPSCHVHHTLVWRQYPAAHSTFATQTGGW
jgi:hypothetical protein